MSRCTTFLRDISHGIVVIATRSKVGRGKPCRDNKVFSINQKCYSLLDVLAKYEKKRII